MECKVVAWDIGNLPVSLNLVERLLYCCKVLTGVHAKLQWSKFAQSA